ncbi:MAG: hypothetical protein ACLPSF_11845, partial [Methylocella sp.]
LAQILRVSSAHRNPSSNQHGKRITNCAPEESQSDSASRENALETRTDRFAVAVLAPFHRIRPNEDATLIALRFGVSKQAAEIRADEAARDYRRKNGLTRPIPDEVQKIIDQLRNGKKGNL